MGSRVICAAWPGPASASVFSREDGGGFSGRAARGPCFDREAPKLWNCLARQVIVMLCPTRRG
eukprot:1486043-Lingulodinium_polyedra.AAC.1